jgi:serine/threonine-protein kinase
MPWFSRSKSKVNPSGSGPHEGALIGPYRLERKLGEGAVGVVWLARHPTLGSPAAIKIVHPEQARSERVVARFELEAQSAAALSSPHIARVWDFGPTDFGSYYYASEFVDGLDLYQMVKKHGPVPQARAVFFAEQVCDALGAAHDRGMVHRDLKPGNIMVERNTDIAKVVDFGLVRAIGCDRDEPTTPVQVAGTPAYLAPEVIVSECRGECDVDGRADLYALGCVLYWLLTAKLVFDATTPEAQAVAHATEQPKPPSEVGAEVHPSLERLILRCIRKDPDERPRDARQLRELLRGIDLGQRWSPDAALAWWSLAWNRS